MTSICGIDCPECFMQESCMDCSASGSCHFGENCFIARYIIQHGVDGYDKFLKLLINEIHFLAVPDMPDVAGLNALKGSLLNLEYTLENGQTVKLLNDNKIYLGTQLHKKNSDRYYGIVADDKYILVCEYGQSRSDPKIILYMQR